MLKRLLLAALCLPLIALAQSYPSPTFNNLTVNGTFTSSGNIGLASLAAQAANTVLANVTGALASPTAVAIPSCNTANSALQYTSGTGLSCGIAFALTSGTLAQFAATTSAQLAGVVSDETGSGALVFGTSPTITGATISGGSGSFTTLAASSTVSGTGFSTYLASPPAIGTTAAAAGKFTTLQVTSTITPSSTAGIVGTTASDNANAGSVGEYISANNFSGTSLVTNTSANIASISLSAGDWDVRGDVILAGTGGASMTTSIGGISTTSATIGALGTYTQLSTGGLGSNGNWVSGTPVVRINVSSTTTVYLIGYAAFSSGGISASGVISARRIR